MSDWRPNSAPQEHALTVPYFETLYGGARGGGKTDAGLAWMLKEIKHPQLRGLVIRKNADDLSDWVDRAHHMYGKYGVEIVNRPPILRFPSGALFKTGHLRDDQAYTKYQGHEYQRMLIEELTQIATEKRYKQLLSSCRSTVPGLEARVFATTNPGGAGHGWVKKRWRLGELPTWNKPFLGGDTGRKRIFIPAKVDDNIDLMRLDPNYVKMLDGLKETDYELYKAWRLGSWDVFAGQVFREFRTDLHVVESMDVALSDCIKIICFDWGYNAPGCAIWLAIAPENQYGVSRVYAYREIYQRETPPEKWAEQIRIFTSREGANFMCLPHDCFAKPHGGRSIASIFKDKIGTKIIEAGTMGKGFRLNRLAVTHQFLSTAADGKPYLQLLAKMDNTIRTVPEMVYDDIKIEDVDSDSEDHCLSGGTLVLTSDGWQRIDALPYAKITGHNKIILELETLSGRVLKCTPNHKILTPTGWIEAGRLKAGDTVLSLYHQQYKSMVAKDITFANFITSAMAADYTALFGKMPTAQFQEISTSTTLTATEQTTEYPTSNSSTKQNTLAIIPQIQQTSRLRPDAETLNMQPLAILGCPENNAAEQLKKVGITSRERYVYDIGIESKEHAFIVQGGFVVHNCYDALSTGLTVAKQKFKLNSGVVTPQAVQQMPTTFVQDSQGRIVTPDFAAAFKNAADNPVDNRDWRHR